jgi:hypothetical protein
MNDPFLSIHFSINQQVYLSLQNNTKTLMSNFWSKLVTKVAKKFQMLTWDLDIFKVK